jgi:ABC-type metal ion transport system, periplasmic component/surface adhesin
MNIKKSIFSVFTAILVLLAAACSNSSGADSSTNLADNGTSADNSTAETGKLKVITTIFPPYNFVQEITDGNVEADMLLPPGAESHSFEPTPQDIIRIQECDVFIYGGGESDGWVKTILNSMNTGNMKILAMMDMVDTVHEEIVEGMEHDDHDHDDHHEDEDDHDGHHEEDEHDEHHEEEAEYDEHVWTSPINAKKIVSAITETVCELDSENGDIYRKNSESYLAKLDELDAEFKEIVSSAKHKTMIFGDRFPFRYFADAYGLKYYAAFPGCSTDTEPSAATVAFLMDIIEENELPAVFHIEFSNGRMADSIAEGTGAKKLLFHSCHNVSNEDIAAGANYIDLMKQNAVNLREALN